MNQKIIVPGRPVGKGRPRFDRRGHAYTPEGTRVYEAMIARACKAAGVQVRDGPVLVRVSVFWPIPASWSKAQHERAVKGLLWPTTRPDLDNIVKAALDGMTLSGVCWKDDSQCVAIESWKHYSEQPRI